MKRLIIFLTTIIFLSALPVLGFSQLKNYKRGLVNFDNGYYNQAISEFLKAKEIDENYQADLSLKIAESYRLTNRWAESIPYYIKAVDAGASEPKINFYLFYAYKKQNEYSKARGYLQKFIDSDFPDQILQERAFREMNSLLLVESIYRKDSEKEFKNLKSINTERAEFTGNFLNGELVFSASKKNKIYSNDLPYLGLYKAKMSPNAERTGAIEPFSSNIFDPDRNEGSPTFTPDGKMMVFARGNSGKRRDLSSDVDLYMSRYIEGTGWTQPSRVPVSDSLSWDGSPAFSGDGRTLYFSSNRPGGIGGLDIYRVNMDASGRFGNAVNMGRAINTPGDEMFPWISDDGKLYFSSDGHPGLGGLDLFVAIRKDGKISVENMGLPYNSSMDDFGYIEDEYGNEFFTSNRSGGEGDDDIYYYPAPEEPVEVAELPPTDEKEAPKIVNYYLEGTVISDNDPVKNAKVGIFLLEAGLQTEFADLRTDGAGNFGPIKLLEDEEYHILTEKEEYLSKRTDFTMYGRAIPEILLIKPVTDTTFKISIILDKVFIGKTFRLENIYYDLDKYDIRPDAAIELDKLVQILIDNPTINIELGSHTDARASEIYNLRLSQRRADAAIQYLVNKGISRERLEARGYGKSELLIENAKTEAEHQQNRRTEFKVTSFSENNN